MRQRAFYLLKYFLVTVCIFIVAKILFMLFKNIFENLRKNEYFIIFI